MLKQHLDMIGRNEPIQRKAKFWQSYVRALKGTSAYKRDFDSDETHVQRMSAIRALLPMKYRFPQFYHPKNDSPEVPPSRTHITTSASRHTRVNVDKPSYSKPMYSSYTGTSAYRRNLDSDATHVQRMSAIRALLPMKYRFPHFYHPENASPSVPSPSLRGRSQTHSTSSAARQEKPAYSRPIYSTYTGNQQNESSSAVTSSAFQRAFSKAVTSYSADFENSRVVTKKTTSYTPIWTTRIAPDTIPAYIGSSFRYSSPAFKYYLI